MCTHVFQMGFNGFTSHLLGTVTVFVTLIGLLEGKFQIQLRLNNSSPAVLDSNITFVAELDITSIVTDSSKITRYKYVWIDSTTKNQSTETFSNKSSVLSKEYTVETMDVFKPGTYNMRVQVFEKKNQSLSYWKNNEVRLATGTITFNLTERLNTQVFLNQSLSTISPEGVFATHQNLNISVKVIEIFSNATLKYELYTNHTKTVFSQIPKLSVIYKQAGSTNISIKTIANILVTDGQGIYHNVTRYQWVNKTISLKDAVNHIEYLGNSEYAKGQNISASFKCYGSPPFLFSWEMAADIQPRDSSLKFQTKRSEYLPENIPKELSITDPAHKWKSDTEKKNHCFTEFRYVFNVTGNFTVYLRIQNDVGYKETHVVLQVVQLDWDTLCKKQQCEPREIQSHSPLSGHGSLPRRLMAKEMAMVHRICGREDAIQPLIIVASVIIAVFAFALIFIVYMKERHNFVQTPNEETADHYFYFNKNDGNALKEYRSVDGSSVVNSSSYGGSHSEPRRMKAGLSVMYNTAKNWVTGIASSYTSQNSVVSYEEL